MSSPVTLKKNVGKGGEDERDGNERRNDRKEREDGGLGIGRNGMRGSDRGWKDDGRCGVVGGGERKYQEVRKVEERWQEGTGKHRRGRGLLGMDIW